MKNKITFEELWNRLPEDVRTSMENCEQDPLYHPEGDAGIHTKLVFEYANDHFDGDVDLLVSAIFHDLGKPETQKITDKDGRRRISNIGHERKCDKFIDKYFDLFEDITTNKEKVKIICNNHMKAHLYNDGRLKKPSKRKAFEDTPFFEDIINFSKCDSGGR